ncbi:OmpA family protein [Granulosicoccus antarcticus]|uniref:Putative lipoprotein YiaD n=1 Tax=Granulosicoccus antarcticus IMCC3135 TaxID=1192854 RepID=A0A2Z2P2N2_9GAMM|nr:OmpA family protein [Granulosicoccus antarcticus]ASJ76588.1 putative lipoprotein YiaD [Granulosicoccus antarcticus IMCC3135]
MNTGKAIALGACLSLISLGVSAQVAVEGDVEASGDSYVAAGGMVLKTGLDECLHTGTFSDDAAINVCEGIEDVVEEVAEVEAPVVEEPKVVEAPAAPQGKIDTRQFSEQTLFDTDSAQLTSAGEAVMNDMFSALSEYKGITGITVIGYTDSRGEEEYNLALSKKRAQTIADIIAARYPDLSMDVIGMGETAPVASNDTAEGRQLNRRVEVDATATRMIFN